MSALAPLCIIPARSGSQGIPGKSFRPLADSAPVTKAILVAYQITPSIVVTTDNPSFRWHDVIIHQRPPTLASHTASMADVVLDVLQAYPGDRRQPILLLQPTQPLRKPSHLQHVLRLLESYPSVATVVEVEPAAKLYYISSNGNHLQPVVDPPVERRQSARATYACDGTCYGFLRGWFENNRHFCGPLTMPLIIPPEETCRLDTPFDWAMAELRLASQ